MDQNQMDNSDLQKAIDDITKTTSVDPVFSDPVAAPSSVPEGDTGALGEPVGPFPEPQVTIPAQSPEPMAPLMTDFALPPLPEVPEVPAMPEMPAAPAMPVEPAAPEMPAMGLNMAQVKEAALRDLAPILDHMNVNPAQKFRIYRDMIETLHDNSVAMPALEAAKQIQDENARAEALLYLVTLIDEASGK